MVPLGTVLRWYTTECLRDVALIRPGFAGPPSPSGKALSTRYNFAEQYHPKKPSPGVKLSGGQFDSVKSSLNKGGCEADG